MHPGQFTCGTESRVQDETLAPAKRAVSFRRWWTGSRRLQRDLQRIPSNCTFTSHNMSRYRGCAAGRLTSTLFIVGCLAPSTDGDLGLPHRTLTVLPDSMVVSIGAPRRLTAVLSDSRGQPVGAQRFAWKSLDTNIARVDT